jgi:hypothetical protein
MRCSKSVRRRSRAPELLVAAALALAACGQPAEKADAPTNPGADGSAAPPHVENGEVMPPVKGPLLPKPLHWAASSSDEGNAIVLIEGEDTAVLRIACLREKGLVVYGERLKPVGSEERMSIGAGNTVATLAATAATDRNPPTVKGEGAIDEDFVRAVGEGRKIAVNYGYQNMGPFDGPPAEMAQNFVAGCQGGGG